MENLYSNKNTEPRRILVLTAVMAGITFSVLSIALCIQYRSMFEQEKNRLIEIVRSQKVLIESIARFDVRSSEKGIEGRGFAATISQIVEAHESLKGFGETGEFTLGRREGDSIVFMLTHRHGTGENSKWIPMKSDLAEPMRRALSGQSGWILGLDYRGETVFAAYEPIEVLNLGLVAKIDLSELRAPFIQSAVYAGCIALIMITLGSIYFVRSGSVLLRKLGKSEADLARAQKIAHFGSWSLDLKENKLNWSDEVYRIFGLQPQELDATYDMFLGLVHPEDRESVKQSVDEAIHLSKPYDIDHRIVLPDGIIRVVNERSDLVFSETGEPVSMMGTVLDITERKQAEEELEKHRNHLEEVVAQRTHDLEATQHRLVHSEKLGAIGKLSASIAHEFNNPIFSIKSALEEISEDVEMDKGSAGLLDIAVKECDRIARLTRSLQDFNRPSLDVFEAIDIHKAIDEILLLSRKNIKAKNIELCLNYDKHLPEVEVVPDQFKQVVLNMLQNAEEAIDQGGSLTITTEQVNSSANISISDTGCGIPPDIMKNIFEPFFTTKSAVKGTGLGLSVCHGIVELHGGEIKIDSRTNQGTTVTLVFPLRRN